MQPKPSNPERSLICEGFGLDLMTCKITVVWPKIQMKQ